MMDGECGSEGVGRSWVVGEEGGVLRGREGFGGVI